MEATKEGDTADCTRCAYHCQFPDISLFMQLRPKRQIFFIADMITNRTSNFEILKKNKSL